MTFTDAPPLPFKLSPPSAERCLPRPRLFEKLDGGGRLVWVSAPAGSGKTSLVSGWLKARGLPALWYHIDGGDAEPAAFFAYLGQAGSAFAPAGAEPLPLLTPEYAFGLPVFARNFFRRLWQSGCRLLVLDDYHELPADAALHGLLRHGLEETPADCRVVAVSRNAPPPELAKLRLGSDFTALEWSDLRLDDRECSELAALRLSAPLPAATASALNRRVGGWATGLVLALERGAPEQTDRLADDPLLFDFFAAEILAGLEPELRDFLLLCALLPAIRPANAAELTGRSDAAELLANLARRNLFTICHRGVDGDSYEFHPLFKHFLMACLAKQLSTERRRDASARAARILCAGGDYPAGIALFRELNDWPALADALLTLAPQWLHAGRIEALAAWLEQVPASELDHRPWLRYFQGACRLPFDPVDARRYYELAYSGFDTAGDALGCYSAWIALCASFIFAYENLAAADPWLAKLPDMRRRYPDFPDRELEAGVLTYSLYLPTLRHPDTPGLESVALRLEDLTPGIIDPQLKVSAASNLMMYWLGTRGDSLRAGRLIAYFGADSLGPGTPPLIRLMWETMHAFHHWLSADMAGLEKVLRRALEFGTANGVRVLDCYFSLQTVLPPAYAGDRPGVARALADLAPFMARPRAYDAFQYHFMRLLEARCTYDPAAIEDAAGEVERYAARTEILSCTVYALLAAAWRSEARQDLDAARNLLDGAKAAGQSCGSVNTHWDVLYAVLALASAMGDTDAERQALAEFLAYGKRYGLANCYGIHWHRPALARFCALALRHGIVPDYARKLIRLHALQPERPPLHPEGWPWPVRIRTLGGFEIQIDGQPLYFSASRVPVKPLELLKALIGFGASDVSQDRLADALWPEADGDAARRALHTNLHRLRSLLGDECLSIRDGRLSLDPKRCWTDVGTVNALAKGDGLCACSDTANCPLPNGHTFLPYESDLPWLIQARERVTRSLAAAQRKCRKSLAAGGGADSA